MTTLEILRGMRELLSDPKRADQRRARKLAKWRRL